MINNNSIEKPGMASKFNATQTVIRNKFKKAYKNRIEQEQDVSRAMNPLTSSKRNDLNSKIKDFSLPHLSNHATEPMSIKRSEKRIQPCDVNALCDILRTLQSSPYATETNCMQLINVILEDLKISI